MCLNLLLRSLNVADGFVHKSQICFNVKLNIHLYVHSFLVLMFIMFPTIKLKEYMIEGQNQPQTLNYD